MEIKINSKINLLFAITSIFIFSLIVWKINKSFLPLVIKTPEEKVFNPELMGWKEASGNRFTKRDSHMVYEWQGKLFVTGGLNGEPAIVGYHSVVYENAPHFNDIWQSEDGINWSLVKDHAEFPPIRSASIFSLGEKLYMYGGWSNDIKIGYHTGVWESTDGINWTKIKDKPDFPEREGQKVLISGGKVYLFGGVNYFDRKTFNDVWESADGVNWVELNNDAPWHSRWDHDVAEINGKMILAGGMNFGSVGYDDIWESTDGKNWIQIASSTPWGKRQGPGLVFYKDYLWFVGGLDAVNDSGRGDSWFSKDGVSWSKTSFDGGWVGREDHLAYVFKDKFFINGGMGSNWKWQNDIWFLDEISCGQELISKIDLDILNNLSAKSYGVYCVPKNADGSVGEPLFLKGKDIHEARGIASITKLMTSVVADESFGDDYIFRISDNSFEIGSENRYSVGEEFSKNELLNSLLIESDNDVAKTFANTFGYEDFVSEMNLKAKNFGMMETIFKNPSGIDADGKPGNISSVSDISKLIYYIFTKKDFIVDITGNSFKEIKNIRGENHHLATTTNEVLTDLSYKNFVLGAKTGNTPASLKNLATIFKTQDGRIFISVVLGSEDHFADTKKIIDTVNSFK